MNVAWRIGLRVAGLLNLLDLVRAGLEVRELIVAAGTRHRSRVNGAAVTGRTGQADRPAGETRLTGVPDAVVILVEPLVAVDLAEADSSGSP